MTLVNLTAAVPPAISARLADGTARLGGVVVQDVATKQVVQWLPAVQQAGTNFCARLGPLGLVAVAALGVVGGVWAIYQVRKARQEAAALGRQNADLAEENATLQRFAGEHILREALDGPPLEERSSSEAGHSTTSTQVTSEPKAQATEPSQVKKAT